MSDKAHPHVSASSRRTERVGLLSNSNPLSDQRHPLAVTTPTTSLKQKKLACPYRRKHPRWRPIAPACLHPFSTISRLKEHLYRCHMDPYQCLRCYASFSTQSKLQSHLQATDICVPCLQPETRSFGRGVHDKLKRKSNKGKSDEQKWTEMYQILFPDEPDVPSPYHDEAPLAEYREYSREKLPQALVRELSKSSFSHPSNSLLSEPTISIAQAIQIMSACNDNMLQEFQDNKKQQAAALTPENSSSEVSFMDLADERGDSNYVEAQRQGLSSDPCNLQSEPFAGATVSAIPEVLEPARPTQTSVFHDNAVISLNNGLCADVYGSTQSPFHTGTQQLSEDLTEAGDTFPTHDLWTVPLFQHNQSLPTEQVASQQLDYAATHAIQYTPFMHFDTLGEHYMQGFQY